MKQQPGPLITMRWDSVWGGSSPFRFSSPPPSAPSSWRSSGSRWPRRWWWTSRQGGPHWCLHRNTEKHQHEEETMQRAAVTVSTLTLGVQQLGESQVLLGQVEGILQVVVSVWFLQLVKVDQVRSEKEQKVRALNKTNSFTHGRFALCIKLLNVVSLFLHSAPTAVSHHSQRCQE